MVAVHHCPSLAVGFGCCYVVRTISVHERLEGNASLGCAAIDQPVWVAMVGAVAGARAGRRIGHPVVFVYL